MKIISRKEWGAEPWNGRPYSVKMSERGYFLVHYHGGEPKHDHGDANAKEIESIHLRNGWSGVGYNFIVGQDGAIREGRGWSLVGAHCPGRNRDGIGVYVAVGGDQTPSKEALASVKWLYDEACRKAGKTLDKGWHGKWYATECAGPKLIPWVEDGMPVKGTPTKTSTSSGDRDWSKVVLMEHGKWTSGTIKRLQAQVGVTVDGISGPNTRKAVQKWVGVKQDGIWGPITIKAIQRKVGCGVTGNWSHWTIRAMQRWLNDNRKK